MTSDIAEQKRDYEALKTLAMVLRVIAAGLFLAGFFVFSPFKSAFSITLIVSGALLGFGARGIKIFAKYRFGLIKNLALVIGYHVVSVILLIGLIIFLMLQA